MSGFETNLPHGTLHNEVATFATPMAFIVLSFSSFVTRLDD
jgi:hypothetical protein